MLSLRSLLWSAILRFILLLFLLLVRESLNVNGGADKRQVVISNRGDTSQKAYDLAVISPSGAVCSPAEASPAKTDIQVRLSLVL